MWIGIRMRNRKRPYHSTSYSLTCKINMRVLHFITLVTILNSSFSYDRPQNPQLIDTLCCRAPLFFPPQQRTTSRRTSRAFQQNSHTAELSAAFCCCFLFRGFSPPAVASSRRRVSLMLMRQAGGRRPAPGSAVRWRNVRRNAALFSSLSITSISFTGHQLRIPFMFSVSVRWRYTVLFKGVFYCGGTEWSTMSWNKKQQIIISINMRVRYIISGRR